jgi:hypothetical protein
MSRPEKPIDWEKVDALLLAGCLGTEIAAYFDMHHETFYNRIQDKYKMGFTAYSSQKKMHGDSLLRHAQYKKALKGDNTMMIWLGKNRMGQKEHQDSSPPNENSLNELLASIKSTAPEVSKLQEEIASLKDQLNALKSQTDSQLQ